MKAALISFDLQGTLCDHAFSSELWLQRLPAVFKAQRARLGDAALAELCRDFAEVGENDMRYYRLEYWLERAGSGLSVAEMARLVTQRPRLFPEMLTVIEECAALAPVILLSATTRECITLELSGLALPFSAIYSTCDDFHAPGKPPWVFAALAEDWGCDTEQCVHIGDHAEMDGAHAQQAGWQTLYDSASCSAAARARRVRQWLATRRGGTRAEIGQQRA